MGLQLSGRRPVLAALALVFAGTTLLYNTLWIAASWLEPQPEVELGFENSHLQAEHADRVDSVLKDSPAERAGLRPADRILQVDGKPIEDAAYIGRVWMKHKPGETVRLTIQRPGVAAPFPLTGRFRRRPAQLISERFAAAVRSSFPAPYVLVGLAVLFLRFEEPNAWLLALLFASFSATPASRTSTPSRRD